MAFNVCSARYAHWHLNESSGLTALDSSGNGRNGTLVNMEDVDWGAGKLNNCLSFNVPPEIVDEYVDCGNIANFSWTDSFSVECWFKTVYAGIETLVSRRDRSQGAGAPGWAMILSNGNTYLQLYGTDGVGMWATTTATYNNNAWHHMIATYNGTKVTTGIKIYMDGTLATVSTSGALSANIQNSANCNLAAMDAGYFFFTVNIDEVVIYSRVLTATEVAGRWNAGLGTERCRIPGSGAFLDHNF